MDSSNALAQAVVTAVAELLTQEFGSPWRTRHSRGLWHIVPAQPPAGQAPHGLTRLKLSFGEDENAVEFEVRIWTGALPAGFLLRAADAIYSDFGLLTEILPSGVFDSREESSRTKDARKPAKRDSGPSASAPPGADALSALPPRCLPSLLPAVAAGTGLSK